jgi:hypothetical protein
MVLGPKDTAVNALLPAAAGGFSTAMGFSAAIVKDRIASRREQVLGELFDRYRM